MLMRQGLFQAAENGRRLGEKDNEARILIVWGASPKVAKISYTGAEKGCFFPRRPGRACGPDHEETKTGPDENLSGASKAQAHGLLLDPGPEIDDISIGR